MNKAMLTVFPPVPLTIAPNRVTSVDVFVLPSATLEMSMATYVPAPGDFFMQYSARGLATVELFGGAASGFIVQGARATMHGTSQYCGAGGVG